MRSVADDPDAATLCGVAIERTLLSAFAVAGLLAAVAGLLYAPSGAVGVDQGVLLGLYGAAAAARSAGSGSPRDAVVGGVVLGVLQQLTAGSEHLGAAWASCCRSAVLVVVLAVRPDGCWPQREAFAE